MQFNSGLENTGIFHILNIFHILGIYLIVYFLQYVLNDIFVLELEHLISYPSC